jgi:hypothetical protein
MTGPYTWHRHNYVLSLATDSSVTNWQVNKRTIGSAENAQWSRLCSANFGEPGTWYVRQVRVANIKVHFDNRSATVSGGSGSVAFSASPRVAACLVPFTEAELASNLVGAIEDFAGQAMSLTAANRTVNIPVPPSVAIGNFGSDRDTDTRLLIYQSGYNGKVTVEVTYQVMGWPSLTLALAGATSGATVSTQTPASQDKNCNLEDDAGQGVLEAGPAIQLALPNLDDPARCDLLVRCPPSHRGIRSQLTEENR